MFAFPSAHFPRFPPSARANNLQRFHRLVLVFSSILSFHLPGSHVLAGLLIEIISHGNREASETRENEEKKNLTEMGHYALLITTYRLFSQRLRGPSKQESNKNARREWKAGEEAADKV